MEQALTHRSFAKDHNERLEFIGDAVLGYVIAQVLFEEHSDLAEDALTMMRAELVRRETLTEIAQTNRLGEFLRLGVGERKSGGRQRDSILANAVEAIIGAVRQDGGIEPARQLVLRLYSDRLASVETDNVKDAKTRLQEFLQASGAALPAYEVVATRGADHERTFIVSCTVTDLNLQSTGEGRSRRSAEKVAAQRMIELADTRLKSPDASD